MIDPYDRFELILNDRVVKFPIAVASMAGWVDADYALERADVIGAAFLGGYSIDGPAMEAGRRMAEEGRREFLFDDPIAALEVELEKMETSDVVSGLNLRGSDPESFQKIAEAFGKRTIYEIDAHCRQEPMIRAGSGEYLLHHPGPLEEIIRALKGLGVTVSVKVRAGVAKSDRDLARCIWKAGADIIHVDLMDFGYARLRQIRNSVPLTIIANNSVNSFSMAKDMYSHGADLVSLARKSEPKILGRLSDEVSAYADETGWYNAPKQLCRGGDIRALAFCCMPVKDCPLLPALNRIGLGRNEFVVTKQQAVQNTPLENGDNTCFGSLAWCCKTSTPCMFRDITLGQIGLSRQDYMRYKHRMSEKIMARVFHDVPSDITC
ncbi:MAG: methanogenesis marker 9 domain-containing protein [Methanomicrobiaceae archaeon]|nr:methanogenesis marker 9 domain-containing protein [Methanomicrobiaceae archaeon]